MDIKDRVLSRLAAIEPLHGVFPTEPTGKKSKWTSIARKVNSMEMAAARSGSQDILDQALEHSEAIDAASAVDLFSGSSGMREQYTGFAKAGIGFFHAASGYAGMSLHERRSKGGSGTVRRVLIEKSRILLEPERIVVRFMKGVKASERNQVSSEHKLEKIETAGLPPDTYRFACSNAPALDIAVRLMKREAVLFAEPDFIEHIGSRQGDGPIFSKQWHHQNIQTQQAWTTTTGKNIRVVVIDNGFDTKHSDLAFGKLSGWYRATADFNDADFVHGTEGMRDASHGTSCAGMLAGRSKDGLGVAHGCDLSMVACLQDQVGSQTTLARAIGYAARPKEENVQDAGGADIVACSLGPNTANWTIRQVLSDAIDSAATRGRSGKGIAIFWACTNGNYPISADEVCSHSRVIAVGRSTKKRFGRRFRLRAQAGVPSTGRWCLHSEERQQWLWLNNWDQFRRALCGRGCCAGIGRQTFTFCQAIAQGPA